jgi:CheY-like chemotaxis protein/predicted transcriptional regulator
MPKRHGDSFSREVIMRILQILIDEGKLKKTHLAGRARVNYGMCIKYLSFLNKLEWIEIIQDTQEGEFVSITSEGIGSLRRLENEQKNTVIVRSIPSHTSVQSQSPILLPQRALRQRPKLGKRKKVVIIDDDENSLITYRSFLDNSDFRTRTFSDSRKAFEFLTLHPKSYDVIVLDIRMPQMSGLRLYQGIKASNSNAKVIFLSSLDASPELTEIFPEIRESQLLRKPISRNEFIEAILATFF